MYGYGSHNGWGGSSLQTAWSTKPKVNPAQTTIIALLAAFLLVMGVWPIADEPENNPHPAPYRAFLWLAIVVGSVIIATLLLSLILNTTVWKHC
jgi:hypothetical protein